MYDGELCNKVNCSKPLTIVSKLSILDVFLVGGLGDPRYASETYFSFSKAPQK